MLWSRMDFSLGLGLWLLILKIFFIVRRLLLNFWKNRVCACPRFWRPTHNCWINCHIKVNVASELRAITLVNLLLRFLLGKLELLRVLIDYFWWDYLMVKLFWFKLTKVSFNKFNWIKNFGLWLFLQYIIGLLVT